MDGPSASHIREFKHHKIRPIHSVSSLIPRLHPQEGASVSRPEFTRIGASVSRSLPRVQVGSGNETIVLTVAKLYFTCNYDSNINRYVLSEQLIITLILFDM